MYDTQLSNSALASAASWKPSLELALGVLGASLAALNWDALSSSFAGSDGRPGLLGLAALLAASFWVVKAQVALARARPPRLPTPCPPAPPPPAADRPVRGPLIT